MAQKIVMNNFILYGLNRHRNFLKAPICECGCGEKMHIRLDDEEDVKEFCADMLMESDCDNPGMFAVFQDGTYMAMGLIWDEDDIPHVVMTKERSMHLFSEFDAELCLHCYGLICEVKPGQWMIQE